MQPRIDLITLGVRDLAESRRFYVEALGWDVRFEVPGEVVFVQVNHGLLLGLFGAASLAADVGSGADPSPPSGSPPISLAQILPTEDDVRAACERARAAGASVLKEPQHAEFGGFHCYFADPSGFWWEIATNPGWHVDADGHVHIGPIGDGPES
ncbi:MAG: VOC family protein [Actinobacteria bacterium]|nr:VOC family protein [Actinomycetota bacterium]